MKKWIFLFLMFLIIIGIASGAKKPKKTKTAETAVEELGATTTRFYIDPLGVIDTSLNVDDTFSVYVKVEDVTDLAGFEFKLYWDTDVLDFYGVDAHPENLWSSYFKWSDHNYSAEGYYYVSYTKKPVSSTFNGDTTLATVTLRIVSDGLSILDLSGTKLGDSNAMPISHEVGDGVFSNYPCNSDGTLSNNQCHEACGANSFCNFISPGTTVVPGSSSDCTTGNTYTRDKCSDTCQREDTDICDNYCGADWTCHGRASDSVFCFYYYEKVTCDSVCNGEIEYCGEGASETDGGQNFTTQGTCTDHQGCSDGECQDISYTDYCGSGCLGYPGPCSSHVEESKCTNAGCNWDYCTLDNDYKCCDSDASCSSPSWVNLPGAHCGNIGLYSCTCNNNCGTYTTPSSCEGKSYCDWVPGDVCFGSPNDCSSHGGETPCTDAGCDWYSENTLIEYYVYYGYNCNFIGKNCLDYGPECTCSNGECVGITTSTTTPSPPPGGGGGGGTPMFEVVGLSVAFGQPNVIITVLVIIVIIFGVLEFLVKRKLTEK